MWLASDAAVCLILPAGRGGGWVPGVGEGRYNKTQWASAGHPVLNDYTYLVLSIIFMMQFVNIYGSYQVFNVYISFQILNVFVSYAILKVYFSYL